MFKIYNRRGCDFVCLGLPGKVVKISEKSCVVETMGVLREISTELLGKVKVGDYVLIHAGCAIEIMDEAEAQKTIELFQELQEIVHE